MALNSRIKRIIINIFVVFLVFFFIGLVTVIFFKGTPIKAYNSVLKENMIVMNGIKMVYIVDNDSYVNLAAKTGYADMDNNSVAMRNVNIEYNGSDVKVDAIADSGNYELERLVKVYGNVNGVINDMKFDAGENGTLIYDYQSGKGEVLDGITLYQGQNSIKAKSINFDSNESYILFQDNVSVDYIVGK